MTTWSAYRVVLRLHSPMHIGYAEVGYLRRTRPYVTGRVLRGALVSRVARNQNLIGDNPKDPYKKVSITFSQYLTYTYFYPALKEKDGNYRVQFPWGKKKEDEALFRRRFLSSYTGTALAYPQQSAAEGTLHEIECISPCTLDKGQLVYLMGYILVDEEHIKRGKYDWVAAFRRLQLGGERGYGWGDARLEEDGIQLVSNGDTIFGLPVELNGKRPQLRLAEGQRLLAHAPARGTAIRGRVEPVVGREWRADNKENPKRRHIGQRLAFDNVCFVPGSVVTRPVDFIIGKGGYWLVQEGATL